VQGRGAGFGSAEPGSCSNTRRLAGRTIIHHPSAGGVDRYTTPRTDAATRLRRGSVHHPPDGCRHETAIQNRTSTRGVTAAVGGVDWAHGVVRRASLVSMRPDVVFGFNSTGKISQ
jgi:hypothetical protein